jgi:hypothetical protein
MPDATDLKLWFYRFPRFSALLKSRAIYESKSSIFANFCSTAKGEQKEAHSCTNLAHRRDALRVRIRRNYAAEFSRVRKSAIIAVRQTLRTNSSICSLAILIWRSMAKRLIRAQQSTIDEASNSGVRNIQFRRGVFNRKRPRDAGYAVC